MLQWLTFLVFFISASAAGNDKSKDGDRTKDKAEVKHTMDCENLDHTISFPGNTIHIESKCIDGKKVKTEHRKHHRHHHDRSLWDAVASGQYSVYAEVSQSYSSFSDTDMNLIGGRIGLHDRGDNVFSLAYYKSKEAIEVLDGSESRDISFNYGGIYWGGIGDTRDITDVYVGMLLGTGTLKVETPVTSETSSPLFVLEPEIGLSLQLSRWLQASLGVSYRWVSGLKMMGYENSDLKDTNVLVRFRIGKFY